MAPAVALAGEAMAGEVEDFDFSVPEGLAIGLFFDGDGLDVAGDAAVGFLDGVAEGLDVLFVHEDSGGGFEGDEALLREGLGEF